VNAVVELADHDALPLVCGNVAQRAIRFVGRQVLPPHEHNFPHAHLVFRGAIRCTLIDLATQQVVSVTDYQAGDFFEVPARVGHRLESLSDEGAIGLCLFAVRDEDGAVVYEPTEAQKRDRFNHERLGSGDAG
jgi:quercetin dioxygenase-like cupin family protein